MKHLLLGIALITIIMVLASCSLSPETRRAMEIADQQGCLYEYGSYLRCPHTPAMVR